MNNTLRIILFTIIGISALFSVIREFQKPEKNKFRITFESLVLIGVAWILIGIFM
ncbi:hypothetical protein [Bacillus cereus]|uniref:hypothetical protein n=1 Tax=Bacillus cereus TaxID=1396 RepID=UPI0020C110A9|nr:hypothetical protein [Bacillus cereus]